MSKTKAKAIVKMTEAEWRAEGEKRFGPNTNKWRFVCPMCGNIAAIEDYRQYAGAGAKPNSATCECIGRYAPKEDRVPRTTDRGEFTKPCDYAGYGLLRFSPISVVHEEGKETDCFAFDEKRADEEHQGDPCKYCHTAHDDVGIGPCPARAE